MGRHGQARPYETLCQGTGVGCHPQVSTCSQSALHLSVWCPAVRRGGHYITTDQEQSVDIPISKAAAWSVGWDRICGSKTGRSYMRISVFSTEEAQAQARPQRQPHACQVGLLPLSASFTGFPTLGLALCLVMGGLQASFSVVVSSGEDNQPEWPARAGV